MDFDEIVVDSFSTGHFLTLLKAPGALNEAVPFGPMGEQSKSIDSWIRNPEFTEVHLVCLPEELPVSESIELYRELKSEFGIEAHFYLNKLSLLSVDDVASLDTEARESMELMVQNENLSRIKIQNAGIKFKELPLVAKQDSEELITELVNFL